MLSEVCYSLIQGYGYGLLFILLLLGIIGMPIPDEGVLMLAGALLAKGQMEWIPTMALSITAVLIGTLFNYWVAYCFSDGPLLKVRKKCKFTEVPWDKAVSLIQKYGVWVVPFSYFIPGIRISVSFAAGLSKIPLSPFIVSSVAGSCGWVMLYLSLGFLAVS